jgi:hypothetical protein
MSAAEITTITLLALSPLIIWRMYARIRRMIGRQRLSRIRPWVTLAVFPLLLAFLVLAVLVLHGQPLRLWWLALGLAAGIALAVFGLKRTRFEATPQGLFYTPDVHLGIAISLLFAGRVVYRIVQLIIMGPPAPGQHDSFTTSPATLALIGILAGYFMGYAVGLLRWRFALLRQQQARDRGG